MTMNGRSPLYTALAYHRAWTSRDVALAMTYFDPDIVSDTPCGRIVGIDSLRGFIESISENLTRSELIAAHGGSHTVVLIYDTDTMSGHDAPTVEHLTVRAGRISRMRMIFDRSPVDAARPSGDTAGRADHRPTTCGPGPQRGWRNTGRR